jgi:hypothetical protein
VRFHLPAVDLKKIAKARKQENTKDDKLDAGILRLFPHTHHPIHFPQKFSLSNPPPLRQRAEKLNSWKTHENLILL